MSRADNAKELQLTLWLEGKDQEPVFFSFNMIKKVACLMIDWRSANASNNWLRLLLFKCTVLTPHYQLIVQTQMIHYSRKTFRYLRRVKKFIYPEKGKIRQKFSGKKLQEVFFCEGQMFFSLCYTWSCCTLRLFDLQMKNCSWHFVLFPDDGNCSPLQCDCWLKLF